MFIDVGVCVCMRERGGGGEREGEREREREGNINVREEHQLVASHTHPNGGSNLKPFGARGDAPTNRATWPGPHLIFFFFKKSELCIEQLNVL